MTGAVERSVHGVRFWIASGIGVVVIGWGVALYLGATPDLDRRVDFAVWLVGLDLAHDLLVAPIALAVGVAVARVVRGPLRAPVQAALIASGCVLLVAAAPLARTADGANNPTIQPLDYTTATLTVLAIVWTACALWAGARIRRARVNR
ncbi:MAG TPA: hypothetical protein VFZ83_16415 [Acidimicrobiia bacterium]|nr:hypothetical protein [Acidimicrobiia bacterium]